MLLLDNRNTKNLNYYEPAWSFTLKLKGKFSNVVEVDNNQGASFNTKHFPGTMQKPTNEFDFESLVRQITTPSKLALFGSPYGSQKPWHRQTWFMVALAATSIIIIIMLVAFLCVKSKTYKYKGEVYIFGNFSLPHTWPAPASPLV